MYVKIKLASELARKKMYKTLLGIDLTNLDTVIDKKLIQKLQTFYSFPNQCISREKFFQYSSQTDVYLKLLYMEYKNHKELIREYSKNRKYASLSLALEKYENVLNNVNSVEELKRLVQQDMNIWILLLRISAVTLLENIPCYQTTVEATRWTYTKLNPFFKEDRILLELMNPQNTAAIEEMDFNKFFFEPPYLESVALDRARSMFNSYQKFSKSYEIIILRLVEEYVISIITKLEQNPGNSLFENNVLKQIQRISTKEEMIDFFLENEEFQKKLLSNYYQQGIHASLDLLENRARIMSKSKTYQKFKKKIYLDQKGEFL